MSQNTLITLCLPAMLQKRKGGGSLSLVRRVSPTGVRFLSLAIIAAGGSPVSGISSVSSPLVAMSMILACWVVELMMMGVVARVGCVRSGTSRRG